MTSGPKSGQIRETTRQLGLCEQAVSPFPFMRLPSYSHTDLFIKKKRVIPDSRAHFHSSCCGFLFEGKTSTRMKEFQNGKLSKILGSTPPTAIIPPFQDVGGCLCSVNNYETYDWLLYPAWLSNKIAEKETISS